MLDQLLETKQARQRKPLGTVLSVVLHVSVIGAAAFLTQKAATASEPTPQVLVRVPVRKTEPEPVRRQPAPTSDPSSPQFGHQEITVPAAPTIDIPPVDFSAPPTNPGDFTGEGPAGGRGTGVADGDPTATNGAPFRDFQVDKPAASLAGTPAPAYPEMLKASGVEGQAQVQFVVDTLGRAELGSFKVLQASHDAFGDAVRTALPRMRFLPAEANGRKVRMVVQQTFAFALNR